MSRPGGPAFAVVLVAAACLYGAGQEPGPPPRTSLPMVLTGIMADSADPGRSACLIRCLQPIERKSASMLSVGERACDVAEVTQIRPDVVLIRNLQSDRLESLALPNERPLRAGADAPAAPLPDPVVNSREPGVVSVDLPRAAVDRYLVNLPELLASAQAVPHTGVDAGGRRIVDGFELRQVRAGSVVEKVGLRDGDVVTAVNGVSLDSLPTVLRVFGQAQAAGEATLTVLRGSERMTFVFKTR